jgi:hypothetical protein
MFKKLLILLLVILSASVATAVASQVLLTIELRGTVLTRPKLTLYTLGPTDDVWARLGDPITAIPIPTLVAGTTVYVGSYYLVNTGTTAVTVTYETITTTPTLPFNVIIYASEAWVNADGSVAEVSEKSVYWYNDNTPYDSIYNEDGTLQAYTTRSMFLAGEYGHEGGANAVSLGISLSAQHVGVAHDTPFTLQLRFHSEDTH